ncbi:hypothetical protein EHQ16_12915 [Leptospira kanakyensis]|uniref:Uncharacterized protein n=1 Tax=Leptospira kanakyensis TaxID=2484968 RepID=A0A6N4QDB5_9LEPT|nr:hypothetical protein [Leptospira kanakyensis]TGK49995.1 hypothetical protein EHQ11_09705 [Leptospira kanakyensis]TGK58488.1 hypothetical protein EHQ16_12915 [Leptospira kanakyensis]TGK69133.1 hypothetical protein EHQ18_09865 [Leptospira kanakyensis]
MKKLIQFVVFFVFILNCSSKSENSSEDSLLLLLLAAPKSTSTGTGTDGAACTSDANCASGFLCVSAFNLNQSTTTNRCKAIPTSSGSITINGTASNGTIVTNSPLVDFDLNITSTADHIITAFTTTSSVDLVLEITNAAGTVVRNSSDTNTSGASRERIKDNFTIGTYRVRVKSYFVSGVFGGTVKVQVVNNPSAVNSGGSCNFLTNAGGSSCFDFSAGNTFSSALCGPGGTYNATSSCATVNAGAAPTISGRCSYSINSTTANGQGIVTRVYYSAGTGVVAPVNNTVGVTDCNTLDNLERVIFQ